MAREYDVGIENYPPQELDKVLQNSYNFVNANNKQIIKTNILTPAARPILESFQTSLVLLIPNCIRHHMITYTNSLSRIHEFNPKDYRAFWTRNYFAYCIVERNGVTWIGVG